MFRPLSYAVLMGLILFSTSTALAQDSIIHDAEYFVLKSQNGDRWAEEDKELDSKLADLKKKHGTPPNIVYILWDDQQFGAVGFPGIQKNLGYETPQHQ